MPATAADLALAVGTAAAILAVLTADTDHHETFGHERRAATLHGTVMSLVLVLELVSLGMRLWAPGSRPSAVVLSTVAWLLAIAGAYVGGHMTFAIGTAVNHDAFFEGPTEFVEVRSRDDFPEGEMRRVEAAGLPVVILRKNGLLSAMGAVCTHAGVRWRAGSSRATS